jgi:dTDP-4-dehydrorhamnose reductase
MADRLRGEAMKIFVLGHRGMLGHVLARYLREQGMEVITTEERYSGWPDDPLIAAVSNSNADWIINTIGKLDAKTTSPSEILLVNAQLPVHLKSYFRENQRMIHASTDGVFSGRAGNYSVDAERDATDIYGFSKILGEVVAEKEKAFVLRTSVIGPSLDGRGLFSWLLSQKGPVSGFRNHHWNGITTLEWAKVCAELIKGDSRPSHPIIQACSSNHLSKLELLRTIADTWSAGITIQHSEHSTSINRSLIPTVERPAIRTQLQQLRDWYASQPGKS